MERQRAQQMVNRASSWMRLGTASRRCLRDTASISSRNYSLCETDKFSYASSQVNGWNNLRSTCPTSDCISRPNARRCDCSLLTFEQSLSLR